MRRAIVIVMDGCGAGEAPDAAEFGDLDHPATIRHVWEETPDLNLPTLQSCGFLAACGIPLPPTERLPFELRYGRLQEKSKGGKDSVTGHWEMAGIISKTPFPTYPSGFPAPLIERFEHEIGTQVIGNKPASGTKIIAELGEEHVKTGFPIVYTSADSVFQIACHEAVIPLETLIEFSQIARKLLVAPDNVQRVIARPFLGNATEGFKRTEHRRDFPLEPPPNLCDEIGDVYGIGVIPELFGGRGFRKVRRTQNNPEHGEMLMEALNSDARFIWANFEDFDMRYGHRNDVPGFANCLRSFDAFLPSLLDKLTQEDLLILTADHGNDPTSPSTDHSREYVPFVVIKPGQGEAVALADQLGMKPRRKDSRQLAQHDPSP